MNKPTLIFGLFALSLATGVQAATYFDSVNVSDPLGGSNGGSDSPATTLIGQSFTAGTADFDSVTLTLSAANPGDGASTSVYLIPDDGTGGATGTAGNPTYSPTPGGSTFTGWTNAELIGTIPDSSLTSTSDNTPTNITLSIGSSVATSVGALTANDEYWIVLDETGGSSADWWFNNGSPAGVGTDNQAYWNNSIGVGYAQYGPSSPDGGTTGVGPYQMIITSIPEPTTVGFLGIAIAGLGFACRRGRRVV